MKAQTLTELAAILPRADGGIGLSVRQAQDLLKTWGISKGPHGWPVQEILQKAREHVEREPVADELDCELKKRRIRLLDIQIQQAEGKLCAVDEIVERVGRRDAALAQRLSTLKESEIAKHPAHRNFIERYHNAAFTLLSSEVDA
jgi:hypothetical protein